VKGTESDLIGQRLWLEYFDQNYKFDQAFSPQYCTIKRKYSADDGADDWFLVSLDISFEYADQTYDHLLIRSRWSGFQISESEPTAVFLVLVPDASELGNPLHLDMSLYVAWGFCARTKEDIKR
jgi:hypothetical protein